LSEAAPITSLQNPRVLSARKLLRRPVRDRTGMFLVEGPFAIAEALRAGADVRELFVTTDAPRGAELTELAASKGTPVTVVSDSVLRSMSDSVTPQGIVAVAGIPTTDLADLPDDASLVIVLAGVRDPGNAGTLVRSAVAAGADAVVFTDDSVDPYGPKTVRAAAGGVFLVPVVVSPSFESCVAALRERGLAILGASATAERGADEVDLTAPVALVLGNEAWGIAEGSAALLDGEVGIWMPGPAESLNVGIAGSILLFEAVRRRRLKSAVDD
jgi:TrmH family RNA methyltransferase